MNVSVQILCSTSESELNNARIRRNVYRTHDFGQHSHEGALLREQDESQADALKHLNHNFHWGILTQRDRYLASYREAVSIEFLVVVRDAISPRPSKG